MPEKRKVILHISAKCSDLFSAYLMGEGGHYKGRELLGEDYTGYVPDFMPGEHYGDYVDLEIDVNTGQILNWKRPTEGQLRKVFKIGW